MFYEVAPFMESSNINDNEEELVDDEAKSILGCYIGSLSSINSLIKIELETRFYSMEIATHFIEQYTFQNNFATFKHKSEKFSDNIYLQKKSIQMRVNSPIVTVMSFNNEHNHEISTDTVNFAATYKCFSEEIMEQIEFYIMYSRCDAGTIRNLLQLKYPDCVFLTQDLGNAIQRLNEKKN
ncbi:hypothetical protein RhiirA4_471329 [Rhizophagus irregularis]|uniref:FAR1 domain-containing protein n=1 Tax=Rhizophagus irregularis TaxID=588596 RepID=A0A2I1H308_9GLOM|nr:hypothetical protein RhiirA4_471329 [Rhizophagus irregularis]